MDIKKEFLETIKKLYFMCNGDENIEHLYSLPSQWINLLKYESISDKIYENLKNASCTPIKFFAEENLDSWHPRTHGPCNYLQIFIWMISFKNAGKKHYPFAGFRNVITR